MFDYAFRINLNHADHLQLDLICRNFFQRGNNYVE